MFLSQPIPKRAISAVMGLALFMAMGGPLALLQGIAWANMVHDFSKNGSLCQAVTKTFDGHHLCPLCQKLAKARAAEEKAPVTMKIDKKTDFYLGSLGSSLPEPLASSFIYGPSPFVSMPERIVAPPVPVPIAKLS